MGYEELRLIPRTSCLVPVGHGTRIAHPDRRMRRQPNDRKCTYVVLLDQAHDLRELARYLTTLGVADCDVVILDPSPRPVFETNARTLRWVGRHLHVPAGPVDLVRCANAVAACEKVIVATEEVRYTAEALVRLCALLELHEVVEPQDYLDPLPWWGGIDAGGILLHRGIEPQPEHGATFGFRRGAVRSLRHLGAAGDELDHDPARRLAAHGAEVYAAADVFVRREPRALAEWVAQRPRLAGHDFTFPVKTAFFLTLLPLLLLLAFIGGPRLASGYAGVISFVALGLAVRGRIGAASFFPWRACLFAPLWIFERSVSVYWALLRRISGADVETTRTAIPDRARGQRAASGE